MLKKAPSLLILTVLLAGPLCAADVPVPWDANFNLPPRDSNGWSVLTPSADSRLIYVSDSQGDDANSGLSESLPKKTVAAAMTLVRNGFPDWVLLKKGDTWTLTSPVGMRSGRSVNERMVLTSYGAGAERPVLQSKNGVSGIWWWQDGSVQFAAVIGIKIYSFERDPANPAFVGFPNSRSATGFWSSPRSTTTANRSILIEDCVSEFYGGNVIQGWAGGNVDIIVRRSQFLTTYSTTSHSSAMYTSGASILLEENLFDHGGWYKQSYVSLNDQAEGQATFFNHNTYFSNAQNTIFRRNIFSRSSSIQNKWTANSPPGADTVTAWNHLTDNNFYIDGEIGISAGGNDDRDTGYRWRDIRIVNNVIQAVNLSRPTNRGLAWGIDALDWDGGAVSGNILANYGNATTVPNSWGIRYAEHMKDVQITGNTVYNVHGTRDMWPDAGTNFQNVQVGNNDVELSAASYLEPNRSIETYMASLGRPATFDAFLAEAKLQSKANWRPQYSAEAINEYFREGFQILGVGGNRPPVVDAGQGRTIVMPLNTVNLSAAVTDDGLPVSPGLASVWTKLSGPGSVTFDDASSGNAAATFSAAGTYVLQFTSTDSEFSRSDTVTIVVQAAGASGGGTPGLFKNVFNPSVGDELEIPCQNNIHVLTRRGDMVCDLVCSSGNARWDGRSAGGSVMSAGIYVLRESGASNRKIIVLK